MFDEWAKNIQAENGLNSDNIYANYANAGVTNASPEQITGKKMASQAVTDENNRKAAVADAVAAAQSELDKVDPSKASMTLSKDGGYNFYDGKGNKININQFSLMVGKRPDEILADSQNPKDQKFVADYKVMRDFAGAWVNGDNQTLQQLRASDPAKYNELISTYKTPADMVNAFRNYYTDYYGDTSGKQTVDSSKFSPTPLPGYGTSQFKLPGDVANTTLKQTLTPESTLAPPQQVNQGDLGSWLDSLNPWGTVPTSNRRYDQQNSNNPWAIYRRTQM